MERKRHIVDALFVLTLFFVYALCSLAVLAVGARVYARTAEDMERNYTLRTASLYLTQKLRGTGDASRVRVETVEGGCALVLEEALGDGRVYETWIYESGGWLCEALTAAGQKPAAEGGQRLMALEGFSAQVDARGLARVRLTDGSGGEEEACVFLRAGGGEGEE